MAGSDDIFREKMRFLEETERRMRRKLTLIERRLVTKVFENVIAQFQVSGALADVNNLTLIDGLAKMYSTLVEPELNDLVKDFGRSAVRTLEFADRYYRAEVQGGPRLTDAIKESDRWLRARLGITATGTLKPGGYLRAVVTDPSMVDGIRRAIYEAVEQGQDLGGIKQAVAQHIKGTGKQSPLTKRFNSQVFDMLQEADAAVNNRVRTALGLMGAVYQGGMIETTRVFCCERDQGVFTEEEIESWKALEWSGKKGHPRTFRGGYECRHQWQWISTARLLRLRPDLELVKGVLKVRAGMKPPELRQGCEQRLKDGLAARRKRLAEAKASRKKRAVKK